MKFIISLFLLSSLSVTFASDFSNYCSNAQGTARWEESDSDLSIYFRYLDSNNEWQSLKFNINDVNISFKNSSTIYRSTESSRCSYLTTRHYRALATITPKSQIQETFKAALGDKFRDYVICRDQLVGDFDRSGCHED